MTGGSSIGGKRYMFSRRHHRVYSPRAHKNPAPSGWLVGGDVFLSALTAVVVKPWPGAGAGLQFHIFWFPHDRPDEGPWIQKTRWGPEAVGGVERRRLSVADNVLAGLDCLLWP